MSKGLDKINQLIEDYDIKRLGFASLRKLLISKSKIEGEVLSDDELAKRVEAIRLKKLKEADDDKAVNKDLTAE
jgi:hypothetical protein